MRTYTGRSHDSKCQGRSADLTCCRKASSLAPSQRMRFLVNFPCTPMWNVSVLSLLLCLVHRPHSKLAGSPMAPKAFPGGADGPEGPEGLPGEEGAECHGRSWQIEQGKKNILPSPLPSTLPTCSTPCLPGQRQAKVLAGNMVPSYSPHTRHRLSPAPQAVLHTGCSGSPRPPPRSSSCSPDGPQGAWKQRQNPQDPLTQGPQCLSFWLTVLVFEACPIESLLV